MRSFRDHPVSLSPPTVRQKLPNSLPSVISTTSDTNGAAIATIARPK